MENLKPKFNEDIFETSELEKMQGKYLAEPLFRVWNEEFVNEDTSEVTSIERREIILDRGVLLDTDNLTKINFHLQCGDIELIKVSDQERSGAKIKGTIKVWCATYLENLQKKKKNLYLYADSMDMSLEIATDYLEQTVSGSFKFVGSKEKDYVNLIPPSEDNEAEDFYEVEVEILEDKETISQQLYVVLSNDAEEAKELINQFISINRKIYNVTNAFETTIVSAKTISISNIVDYNFSKSYIENDN